MDSTRKNLHNRNVCADRFGNALRCIDGRWKMPILAHLPGYQTLRFSHLQRAIPQASQKMLTQHFVSSNEMGLLFEPYTPEVLPRVEYRLTDLGRLTPVFPALADWTDARNLQTEAPSTGELGRLC